MTSNNMGPQQPSTPWGTPPPPPQGYAQPGFVPAMPPVKPKRKVWPWVAGGVATVAVLAAVSGGNGSSPSSTAASGTSTASHGLFSSADDTTTSTAPAGPRTSFGDGQYLVNTQIVPGTYQAPGGSNCYWERQSNLSGKFDGIIANDWVPGGGSVLVTIDPSDVGFKAKGCGTFTLVQ